MQTLKKNFLITSIAVALVFSFGFIYQWTAQLIDDYRYPAPGKLVNIGGYRLHIQEFGQYPPTVIFEAGTGSFSAMWGTVPEAVSSFAHVYTYDRAGLGWSDESPYPRTSSFIVQELHTLLKASGAPAPYILVGHSLGGGTSLLYANIYPDEVYGLVLVDAGSDKITELMQQQQLVFKRAMNGFTVAKEGDNSSTAPFLEQLFLKITSNKWGQWLIDVTGIARLYVTHYYATEGHLPYPLTKAQFSRIVTNNSFKTCSEEIAHYPHNAHELAQIKNNVSEKPLTVIANGKGFFYNPRTHLVPTPAEQIFNEQVWSPLQQELATRSQKSSFIIASHSGHRIQDTEPELIIEAIRKMAADYRKQNN